MLDTLSRPVRHAALLAAVALLALLAVACDARSSDATDAPANGAQQEPVGDVSPQATTLEVALGDIYIRPTAIAVEANTDLTLHIHNEGVLPHDFVIEGIAETPMLDPGQSYELHVGILDPGTYEFICSVPGHAPGGMQGTVSVAELGEHAHAAELTWEEMDRLHLEGVAAFPADTEGQGGVLMEPVMDGDVKVFELTASEFEWEVEPGVWRHAMGYNGMVPGPEIRVQLGDTIRVILHNELSESTAIHFHGLVLPVSQDGVPGLTQPPVTPGETYVYEFTTRNSGSHMYHSHYNAATQVPMGLLGALVIEDPNDEPVDQDLVMILNDGPLGYTIDGKGFPATQPIVAQQGERIRIRYMNEGLQIHPMHLHGMPQLVVARDGYPLPQPYMADTVTVAPGERIDVIIDATEPGPWAFHCHILTHAEGPHGMFGMVTVFIVEE
jgi:manganese oxidase